ncbi:hypothetical protein Tco_0396614 [Tanacetum coccineum]
MPAVQNSDEEDDDEVAMSGDVDNDSDNQDDDDDQNDDNADNENNDNDDDDDGQDHEGQDDDNEQTDLDNNGDDFVHPKFSTYDEEDNEEDESDEITHGANVEGEELDEEEINEEDEANELYRDQSSSVSSGFTSNMLNPSLDTGIDSIFNLNTESTLLVDVPVTTIVEPCFLSETILPSPPTPLITHLQQTLVPTPVTVLSSSLQDLPNFVVSSIPSIVDAYLANKMHEAFKTAVQLQSDILKDEAQAENEDFINKLDDNIKKIIKDQTSHAVAANLSELELKKILIDKMENNKSIHRSDEQKNLYKALVDAYESDKLILDTYGDTVSFKRRRDDEDKDEEPSAGSNWGSKRKRAGKEPELTSPQKEKTSTTIGKSTEGSKSHHKSADKSAQEEEPMHTAKDLEGPAH